MPLPRRPPDDDPDDDGSIYAAERERRHEARYEAELRYDAERQDFIAAEEGRAADQLDSGQTQMLAAIDALRLAQPFEVKSLAPSLFAFRTVSSVSSRGELKPSDACCCRVPGLALAAEASLAGG